ncbi:hypothetical protein [Kitasatospora sp. NPDC085464]|uniref:hypothetical protein n=1 Tax=Kitasatospora sp. NPDC085464 TaxID=3364063 RepID=UPI0037CBFB7D
MSRRTTPARWWRDVQAAHQAGLIPGATATTLTVAQDLVCRMDWTTGQVRYCWTGVMNRTGLSRTAVATHIRHLRAAGWLAWAEHGSHLNSKRVRGQEGYAATATVYAAVVPPLFDQHVGNRVEGAGYTARVVGVTERGRQERIDRAQHDAAAKASRTPSLRVVREEGQVQVSDGFSTTTHARPAKSKPRRTILGATVTRAMADRAERAARYIRPLVTWCQTASLRQLSWTLLDLVARGWDEIRILVWVREQAKTAHGGVTWRPDRPHRYLAGCLRLESVLEAEAARRAAEAENRLAPDANLEWLAWLSTRLAAAEAPAPDIEPEPALTVDGLTLEEIADLRTQARTELAAGRGELVRVMVEAHGLTVARQLLGQVVDPALRLTGVSRRTRLAVVA